MADTNSSRDIDGAAEAIDRASAAGRQALEEGYETAREYGEKSLDLVAQLSDSLTDFVRREPLIAVGAAVLVGYLAAKLLRRAP
ncbi:MAG: hypothetical protein ACLQDV_07880 [Candidatus Binataceae bacterium]